MLSIIHYKSNS